MSRFRSIAGWGFAIAVTVSSHAWAAPIVWDSGPGHNNHSYEVFVVPGGIDWITAKILAEAQGGYLATITSAEENAFVFALVDSPAYWRFENPDNPFANLGPWLGGFQTPGSAEPASGWTWLNGEGAFVYASWQGGEPNNGPGPHGRDEEALHYFAYVGRAANWNDYPDDLAAPIAYVVESDAVAIPAPEPASLMLVASGLLGAAAAARRRRGVVIDQR